MGLFKPYRSDFLKLSWQNVYYGKDIILCGTGPSLWNVDPQQLRNKNKSIFGLNNSFNLIEPDFWMGVDEPSAFKSSLAQSECIKFFSWNHRKNKKIKKAKNAYFYKLYGVEKVSNGEFSSDVCFSGPYISFLFEGYTFSMALQMIYWLGFRKVFLLGCDFGGDSKLSKLSTNAYKEAGQQENLTKALDFLKVTSNSGGLDIISCTENSPINEFLAYKPLSEI